MVGMKQGALKAGGRRPLTCVSSLLQGVPGNNGLPGQPGLTAELVGTGQHSLSSLLHAFPRAELTRLAPELQWAFLLSLFGGREQPGWHVASHGFT